MQVAITLNGTSRDMGRLSDALFCAQMDEQGGARQSEPFDLMRQVNRRISESTRTLTLSTAEFVAVIRGAELAADDQQVHPDDAAVFALVRDELYGIRSASVAVR